jgi:hypothetical protein
MLYNRWNKSHGIIISSCLAFFGLEDVLIKHMEGEKLEDKYRLKCLGIVDWQNFLHKEYKASRISVPR